MLVMALSGVRVARTMPSLEPPLEQNVMKTLSRFVTKFTNLIVAVFSCLDRVIFKGGAEVLGADLLDPRVERSGRLDDGEIAPRSTSS